MVQHTAILTMADLQKVLLWSIERRHFQWPWTIPTSSIKVTPIVDAECLRNGTTYRHSFNEILIGTCTRPTQHCHFQLPWVILSDLAKYSMTQCVERYLCDSWAFFMLKVRLSNPTTQTMRKGVTVTTIDWDAAGKHWTFWPPEFIRKWRFFYPCVETSKRRKLPRPVCLRQVFGAWTCDADERRSARVEARKTCFKYCCFMNALMLLYETPRRR